MRRVSNVNQMRMQRQFQDAAKLIKNHPGKMGSGKHPYPVERDIIILYGLWNGWGYAAIGNYCRLTAPSVRRHIDRLQSTPGDLFKLPILFTGLVGGKRVFRCEFCGNTQFEKDTTEERARLHVAGHVTTEDYIQTFGVRGSGYHGM